MNIRVPPSVRSPFMVGRDLSKMDATKRRVAEYAFSKAGEPR